MSDIDTTKIPGALNDGVKLYAYFSPGDFVLLQTSFESACEQFGPEASHNTVRNVTNLVGFWKEMLDKAIKAAEEGEYPPQFDITFCRGDFFLAVLVLDQILRGNSEYKPLVELREFFYERLYDPRLEQGTGAPFRRLESVLNDIRLGVRGSKAYRDTSKSQRVFLFGVILALLIPSVTTGRSGTERPSGGTDCIVFIDPR
jgi:hypothetical protein